MSELLSECIKREFEKYFQGSCKLPQAHKKVCNENEGRKKETRKKRCMHKNVFNERKWSIILDTMKVLFV